MRSKHSMRSMRWDKYTVTVTVTVTVGLMFRNQGPFEVLQRRDEVIAKTQVTNNQDIVRHHDECIRSYVG